MSTVGIAAILWAFAATGVAMLPMRYQFVPGLTLLILAPVLVIWIGYVHGVIWAVAGLLAFLSMFRRPLRYFAAKALGRA